MKALRAISILLVFLFAETAYSLEPLKLISKETEEGMTFEVEREESPFYISGYEEDENTYFGKDAGASLPSPPYSGKGIRNSFFGQNAGTATDEGNNNTFVGAGAGKSNQSGDDNTFVGMGAGLSNQSGEVNTFVGTGAGYLHTVGMWNTFIGANAGYSTLNGEGNTFVGVAAGQSNTKSNNTCIGWFAGCNTSDGQFNTFVGSQAGLSNDTSGSNTFVGYQAGLNTAGQVVGANVFVGASAGKGNTGGYFNTYIGNGAGSTNETGTNNVFLGALAGNSNTGTGNVFIGSGAGYHETGSNKLYIDNSGSAGEPLIYGEFDNDLVQIYGRLQLSGPMGFASDRRLKKNIKPLQDSLEKVANLQGVRFDWRTDEFPGYGFQDAKQIGFIAQEVEEVLPELVQTDREGYKSVSYQQLTAVLVEAVKEQQREIRELKARHQAEIEELKGMILEMKESLGKVPSGNATLRTSARSSDRVTYESIL